MRRQRRYCGRGPSTTLRYIESIDKRRPVAGLEMRVNLYRCQGAAPDRKYIAWQPTGKPSFHVPEAFGLLKLQ